MNLIFTQYVRQLEAGIDPSPEDFDAVWDKLRDALRSEMIKRSLWSSPPSYLGIYGWNSWTLRDALDELLSDCYLFIFVRRLPGLEALLKLQENIEGLVFRSIRNFLFEKQKQYDPLGYRVFTVLRAATRQALEAGTLHVLAGDTKVGSQTILAFAPGRDPATAQTVDLSEAASEWSDALLPELVTARGARLEEVVEKLSNYILRLVAWGIECFRFKFLIDPFKKEVRHRWQALWLSTQGELAREDGEEDFTNVVHMVRPHAGFEERDSFQKMLICVAEALDRLETRRKTRAYLERLWLLLRNHAAEEDSSTGSPSSGKLPAGRKIAELLDIPRYRLPELHATLGRLVETCRRTELDRASPVEDFEKGSKKTQVQGIT